jgi:hypothetical protein
LGRWGVFEWPLGQSRLDEEIIPLQSINAALRDSSALRFLHVWGLGASHATQPIFRPLNLLFRAASSLNAYAKLPSSCGHKGSAEDLGHALQIAHLAQQTEKAVS